MQDPTCSTTYTCCVDSSFNFLIDVLMFLLINSAVLFVAVFSEVMLCICWVLFKSLEIVTRVYSFKCGSMQGIRIFDQEQKCNNQYFLL